MYFCLVDQILESTPDRIVTIKNVTAAEEYLQDHFPTFPVLPGVLMIEAMVQAARRLLASRDPALGRHVLGTVKALKYGMFVRPGDAMRVEVFLHKAGDQGTYEFKGSAEVIRPDEKSGEPRPTCVSGRFTLRPLRIEAV